MCGIVGIVATEPVNQWIYDGLLVLQHRGQDAAGIMTCEGSTLHLRKDNGLARDVFRTRHMIDLSGHMGIGHVRYPTAGCETSAEAQPFYVNSPFGLALAHNGNLTNTQRLSEEIGKLFATTDSELMTEAVYQVMALREIAAGGPL